LKAKKFPSQNHTPNIQHIVNKQIQNPNPPAPESSRSDSQTNTDCPEEVDGGKASSSSVFSHYDSTLQLLYFGSQVGVMFIPIGKIDPGQTQSFSLTALKTVEAMGPQLASSGFHVKLWGFFCVNHASRVLIGFEWLDLIWVLILVLIWVFLDRFGRLLRHRSTRRHFSGLIWPEK
jgi:hypothetical protein